MHHHAALVGEGWLFEIDFSRSPQPLYGGPDIQLNARALGLRPHGIFEHDERPIERSLVLENGLALRFRRVGRQHRLDVQRFELVGHLAFVEPE